MDMEDRLHKVEETQGAIKDSLHKIHTSVALINQQVETLKDNQQKIIDKDEKEEERRRGNIKQLWMFGAGGLITTFISWLSRVMGFTG